MFTKNDAASFFFNRGFNQERKNADTILNTAKAFSKAEYTVAAGANGRNRLNSGILRNQFLFLLDSLNGRVLTDDLFSGVSLLRSEQYVLIHENQESELWTVYQGNSPEQPKLIFSEITLDSFFNEIQIDGNQEGNASVDHIWASNAPKKAEHLIHSQIIYYGVPGCGKSDAIMKQLKNVPDFNKVRVVFHPEYTNADFVGQILPVVNGGVRYEFCAGPFARILRKAYLNPNQNFYLVIEEMNRGQAAAILGDVFQLCDRIKPSSDKDECGYGPGWSCYGIENDNVNDYIRRIPKTESDRLGDFCVSTEYSEGDNRGHVTSYKSIDIAWESFGQDGSLHFSENTAIRLPPNLSILATMNTSDQNVFTLDNAFQRRFDMKMVENKLKEDSLQYKTQIDGTEVCWGDFWKWCNAKIVASKHSGLASTQDKCLGGWFICGEKQDAENNIPFSKELFAEKVLKYLWDDAFKRDRGIFVDACTSLEVMIQRFKDGNRFASFEAVFKLDDSDKAALRPNHSSN